MRSRARHHLCGASLAIAVLAIAAAGACRRAPAPEPGTGTVAVVTATARRETLRDTLTASGVVVPSTAADLTVVAPESARIAELPHAEGAAVKEGDLLVRYEIPALAAEVAATQSAAAAATAQLDAAKKELDKITALSAQGLIARNDLDARKAAVVDAQSALTTAQGALDRANAAVARAKVTARFAGTIVKVMHQEGDFVSPIESDPILRLVDPTRLQVAVRLSIAELQRVSAGQAATVSLPGNPGEPATVALVPTPTDASATSVEIRLNFAQPTTIPPDTNVEAEIVLNVRENAIVVPRAAVQKDEDMTYVMAVDAESRVHRREVKLGLTTRDLAQVVSGIAFNDRVVTNATGQLVDGMLVQIEKVMRTRNYLALWIVGLTIGWFEAAIVVDLRALLYPNGFTFPLAVMSTRLLGVEVAREVCSLVLLAAIGWLAGQRKTERWGAFLLLFGLWDLVYYVVLKLVLDWPAGMDLNTWDILFLIPVPWTGPIWAPALVAAEFVAIGTYLYYTAERQREYSGLDITILVGASVTVVASFLVEWRAVVESRAPESFPVALFITGVLLGTGRFLMCEERARRTAPASRATAIAPERG